MATISIANLPAFVGGGGDTGDLLVMVDVSDLSASPRGTTKRMTFAQAVSNPPGPVMIGSTLTVNGATTLNSVAVTGDSQLNTLTVTGPTAAAKLTLNGAAVQLTVAPATPGTAQINIASGGANPPILSGGTTGVRWELWLGGAGETGSNNTGSDFQLRARSDAGAFIDNPITIVRASAGAITLGGATSRPVNIAATSALTFTRAAGSPTAFLSVLGGSPDAVYASIIGMTGAPQLRFGVASTAGGVIYGGAGAGAVCFGTQQTGFAIEFFTANARRMQITDTGATISVPLTLTTALGPTSGGTGQSTYATGDVLYASAANTLSKLAIGTANQVLTVIGGVPTWQTPTVASVPAANVTSGTFPGTYTFANSLTVGASDGSGKFLFLNSNSTSVGLVLQTNGVNQWVLARGYFDATNNFNLVNGPLNTVALRIDIANNNVTLGNGLTVNGVTTVAADTGTSWLLFVQNTSPTAQHNGLQRFLRGPIGSAVTVAYISADPSDNLEFLAGGTGSISATMDRNTAAWTFWNRVNVPSGPLVVGTDPGGSQMLRVGGSGRFTQRLTVDGSMAADVAAFFGNADATGFGVQINAGDATHYALSVRSSAAADLLVITASDATFPVAIRANANVVLNSGSSNLFKGFSGNLFSQNASTENAVAYGQFINSQTNFALGIEASPGGVLFSGSTAGAVVMGSITANRKVEFFTDNVLRLQLDATGVRIKTGINFYSGTPMNQQTVSGSRGGNAALANLLQCLHNTGLIVNSTVA